MSIDGDAASAGHQSDGNLQPAPKLFDCRGVPYIKFMSDLMHRRKTRNYFEIGTAGGNSLEGVTCKSVAVDPGFAIKRNVIGTKSVCMFFQMPSDRFFEDYNLAQLLGGPVEVAFLDGFHVFEFLLRDFMNTEKHARRNSIVFMHDCLPITLKMARRRQRDPTIGGGPAWTGDVWKVVPILKKYRPDLTIHALDCRMTGLIMVTGLDPRSTVLDDNYFKIIDEFRETPNSDAELIAFRDSTALVKTNGIKDITDSAKLCW